MSITRTVAATVAVILALLIGLWIGSIDRSVTVTYNYPPTDRGGLDLSELTGD